MSPVVKLLIEAYALIKPYENADALELDRQVPANAFAEASHKVWLFIKQTFGWLDRNKQKNPSNMRLAYELFVLATNDLDKVASSYRIVEGRDGAFQTLRLAYVLYRKELGCPDSDCDLDLALQVAQEYGEL